MKSRLGEHECMTPRCHHDGIIEWRGAYFLAIKKDVGAVLFGDNGYFGLGFLELKGGGGLGAGSDGQGMGDSVVSL